MPSSAPHSRYLLYSGQCELVTGNEIPYFVSADNPIVVLWSRFFFGQIWAGSRFLFSAQKVFVVGFKHLIGLLEVQVRKSLIVVPELYKLETYIW